MIDTHSHLFVEEFDEDLPAVIERARDSGVSKAVSYTHLTLPTSDLV